jgi:hypothetical protein
MTTVPWFPDMALSTSLGQSAPQAPVATVPFYQGILDLAPETLLASWADKPALDDPRAGLVLGCPSFLRYVRATREWLALSDATARLLSVLNTAERSVEEVILSLNVGGERQELGVAIAADWSADHRLTHLRVYHDLRLFPNLPVHIPAISPQLDLVLPAAVDANHTALAAGDIEAILDSYEDNAVVRTFDGAPHVYSGKEELRRLQSLPRVPGARPAVQLCAAVDDGHACAVEYQVTHFAEPLPDRVGIDVYERGPTGKIQAERSYIVSPPSQTVSPLTRVPRENVALVAGHE